MPMKCSRREAQSLTFRCVSPLAVSDRPPPGPRRRSRARGVGRRQGRPRPPPSPPAAHRRRSAPRPSASRAALERSVLDRDRPPPPPRSIQAALARLVVGGRVGVGDEDRRAAGRRDLEDRAARSDPGPGRRRRARRRGRARRRSACSARACGAAARRCAQLLVIAAAGEVDDVEVAAAPRSANASIAAKLTERAPWLPPMTSRQRVLRGDPEALPGRRRDRPPAPRRAPGRPVTR